jgi:hypothetical protein
VLWKAVRAVLLEEKHHFAFMNSPYLKYCALSYSMPVAGGVHSALKLGPGVFHKNSAVCVMPGYRADAGHDTRIIAMPVVVVSTSASTSTSKNGSIGVYNTR